MLLLPRITTKDLSVVFLKNYYQFRAMFSLDENERNLSNSEIYFN